MSRPLHHLTMNTGHVVLHRRGEVAQDAVDRLLPVLDAEGGTVPGLDGWYLDFFFPRDASGQRLDGAAFFQIADEPGTSKRPAVMAVACWEKGAAAEAWDQARQGYILQRLALEAVGLWRATPAEPPPLPWLAVWLMPAIALADLQALQLFGDLERCVAFALVNP